MLDIALCSNFLPFFGIILIFIFIYLLITAFNYEGTMISLHFKESALTKYLLNECPRLVQLYYPTFWATNCHMQTFLSLFLPQIELQFDREFLQMKDCGIVALDWAGNKCDNLTKQSPIIIFIPGILTNSQTMSNACQEAIHKGFRPVIFNRRGFGNTPLTTPRYQSLGDPLDLRQVVKYIRGKYNKAKITAVGYSAGSDLLLSYLGEYGSSAHINAGVAISFTFGAEELFTKGLPQPYHWIILQNLKRLLIRHAIALGKVIDVNRALQCNTLSEFDELVYCKMYGYENLHKYWDKNNPMRDVDEVSIPLLCINSVDDPICHYKSIPFDLFKIYPNFLLAATNKGGHAGFYENIVPTSWADKLTFDYLRAVLDFTSRDDSDC